MSLKELSKDQKQYIVLGLLAAVILAILATIGVKYSLSSIAVAKDELEQLSGKIEKADRALSRREITHQEYQQTVATLRTYLENAPPERNTYSWANEVIYSFGRAVGLEIDSIDEISIPHAKVAAKPGDGVKFEAYTLRITAHGGYENTKTFLNRIKADYPLVRFTGIEISSGSGPELHNVQLFMQWPCNLGELGKNWDAIESSQGAADKSDPIPVQTTEPAPKREPHPPVSKPEPVAKPSVPKAEPVIEEHEPGMPTRIEDGLAMAAEGEDALDELKEEFND